MSNIQTGAERMPHDLSHLGFLAGQIGRLITISTTPVIAGDSFEMDAVGALRLSPLRRGLAIDSTVDIFTMLAYQQKESTARVASIMENTNLSKQQQVSEIMRQMLTQAQTAGQYFTNDQIKEMTRKVSAEV